MSFWYQYQVCLISDWKYSAFYFYSNRNPYFKFCLFNFYVTQQIKLNHFVKLEIFSRYNSLKVAISIELKPFFKCLWFSAAHLWDQSRILNLTQVRPRLEKAGLDFFQTVTGSGSSGNRVQMVRELHTGHCGSFALTFAMTFIWRVSAVGTGWSFTEKTKKESLA